MQSNNNNDCKMEKQFDINLFYEKYNGMSTSERKMYISRLRQAGISIRKIECFSYSEAPGIKHALFTFDNSNESIPYFMLDREMLLKIAKLLFKAETVFTQPFLI